MAKLYIYNLSMYSVRHNDVAQCVSQYLAWAVGNASSDVHL